MNARTLWIAAALLVTWGAWSHWQQSAPRHPAPGVLAAESPVQVNLDNGVQLQRGDTTLTTRAHFDITARVLSRKDYNWAAESSLVPVDLALGWGRMSDSEVLAHIEISQSGRFYYWRASTFPIPRREIETSSANMHLIPASKGIKRQLERVRSGQVVRIEGFLVNANRANGWHWNTSMTRNDTGAGACELIYVESITIDPS
ncbi:MAG: hypothetical protein ACTS5I_03510 [Rhodanobacter sp.]